MRSGFEAVPEAGLCDEVLRTARGRLQLASQLGEVHPQVDGLPLVGGPPHLGEQLLAVGPKLPEEFRVDMTPNEVNAVYYLTVFGLPFAVGMVGVTVWLRRRK